MKRTRRAVTPHKTVAPGKLNYENELLRQRAFYDEEARNDYKSHDINENLSDIKG